MTHKHSVRDTGTHYLIDQYTRQIVNDSAEKATIVQYDHNSERLTFSMPLYVDGHAMTLCDLIEIHYINIATDGKTANDGVYKVADIKADGENAVFTWLVSQEATQLVGSLNFLITFKCTEDGVTVYRWSTTIYKNLAISDDMDNGEAVLTEYPDILAQWQSQLFSASETAVLNITTAEANALASIESAGEAKKQSVLDSIPDNYTALSDLCNNNYRNKAGAIVIDTQGESIVLNDASEYPLQNLKVFGKSTQDGTPTPEAPVDIVSVETPVVNVYGKNLLKNTLVSKTHLGCDIVVNDDGSVIINGTATSEGTIVFNNHLALPCGNYILSGERTVAFLRGEDNTHKQTFFTGKTITIEDPTDYLLIGVYANKGQVFNDLKTYPMLRLAAETDDSFELYKETQTVETAHILHGIPVSSGGNYTDADGQQWICDEVDLARGVYVQRIYTETTEAVKINSVDNAYVSMGGAVVYFALTYSHKANDDICVVLSNKCLGVPCNDRNTHIETYRCYAPAANPKAIAFRSPVLDGEKTLDEAKVDFAGIIVNYVLATPIETPLSDAEINAFRALHTNKPNTTVLNDAGAYMSVEYIADTKTYIDNKFAELG